MWTDCHLSLTFTENWSWKLGISWWAKNLPTLWANMAQTRMMTDPNQLATTIKNQENGEVITVRWKNGEKNKLKTLIIVLETETAVPRNLSQTTTTTTTTTKALLGQEESQTLLTYPVRQVEKQTNPEGNAIWESKQPIDTLPETGKTKSGAANRQPKHFKRRCKTAAQNLN